MDDKPPASSEEPTAVPGAGDRRIAFERLRERTDELELIISGISLVALLALPGWLIGHLLDTMVHLEGQAGVTLAFVIHIAMGVSYGLAAAFLLHLAVRAYWVGLIGLKATFPNGIQWQRLRNIGPVGRADYQRRVPDLFHAIDGADRLASMIFALATLIAVSLLWVGLLFILATLLGWAVNQIFGWGEQPIAPFLLLLGALTVLPLLITAIDAGVGRWRPAWLAPGTRLQRMVQRLIDILALLYPMRLILPVQLTMQSNLPRYTFSLFFGVLIAVITLVAALQVEAVRQFAPFGHYEFLDTDDVRAGVRSGHYESLRGERDRVLRLPMIPSDIVVQSHLRVFLPYVPDRDNPLLRERCGQPTTSAERVDCLRGLWQLRLNDAPVAMSTFEAAERRELGLRGLLGYLPLAAIEPGRQELVVRWGEDGDDGVDYRIPFWFAPAYELDLEQMPAAQP